MATIDLPDAIAFLQQGIDNCAERRTAIEAGAYIGKYTKHLASKFEFVLAFEPIKENFERLERGVQHDHLVNVTIRQEALGSRPGKAVMNCKDTAKPYSWCTGPCAVGNLGSEAQTIVDLTTIDSLHLRDVDFITLDVNGAEYRVLKGAVETIQRCKPIILLCEDKDPHRFACVFLKHLDMKQIAVSNRTFVFGW